MANLKFADTHNLVAFLSKPEESDGFEQIVDFLNAQPIRYALTVNPTNYTSCIEQFWATVKVKTVNGEVQIHALVDGKKIIINESVVRRDLQLEDAEGIDCLPNSTIFEQLALMAHTKDEANVAFIEEWDDIQAKIGADHELAQRLQAEEQEGESYAEEKRNKPPTQAQQRKIMCTYLKNMEGKKLKDLKNKYFDFIQKMFDKSFKRENTFVEFRTDLEEGSSKRIGEELEQESTKKQKVDEDKDTTEL
ncbi:hypothetical protein Tco_0301091 [Tanacetum coccineum]